MMKKNEGHSGMRSPTMPKKEFEHKQKMAPVCGEKYAGEFSNPNDLDNSTKDLANYVKKNKMKY